MQHLEDSDCPIEVGNVGAQLALFRKHFLIMNALYRLQDSLWEEGVGLRISALEICLIPVGSVSRRQITDPAQAKLREYYQDWQNFDNKGEAYVQELLNSFWTRYLANDEKFTALKMLELDEQADWSMVRDSYRRLVNEHHPDKGGDQKRFIEIREAFEILRCCYQQ